MARASSPDRSRRWAEGTGSWPRSAAHCGRSPPSGALEVADERLDALLQLVADLPERLADLRLIAPRNDIRHRPRFAPDIAGEDGARLVGTNRDHGVDVAHRDVGDPLRALAGEVDPHLPHHLG